MKKGLYFVIAIVLLLLTGCYPSLDLQKERLLQSYSCEENYVRLTGVVMSVDSSETFLRVNIRVESQNKEQEYLVFANFNIDIEVGDSVEFATIFDDYYKWNPIVSIVKNDKILLNFEEGKQNLISWVKQLKGK